MFKRVVFFALLVGFNYVALELIAYAAYSVKYGTYDSKALQTERSKITEVTQADAEYGYAGLGGEDLVVRQVTHPYVGYVVDGKRRVPGCDSDAYECYERIRTPIDGPMPKRQPNQFIVGVLGGSVAVGTFNASSPNAYQNYISQHVAAAKDKEVVLVGMAAGGYKQPQQLMLLNYMLAQGAEFDLLINIDGFNEVAIPSSEFKRSKLHPTFPRAWEFRVGGQTTPEFLDLYSRSKYAKDALTELAAWTGRSGLRKSPTVNLYWTLRSTALKNEIAMVGNELEKLESADKPRDFRYAELGPDVEFTNWDEFNEQSIWLWMRSSVLMDAVARAHGIRYFHFLQPNQYVDGSKVLTEREKQIAILKNQGYGWRYKLAYPMLKEMAKWLTAQGVHYFDLSSIYQAERGDIYIDNCCHVNVRGSDLIIQAAAQHVGREWQ